MENKEIYVEKFFFRTRTHTIEDSGIRTVRNDFWVTSDVVTRYESLGRLVQYQSNTKLSDWFVIGVFLILGIKGLLEGAQDNSVFAICIILIAVALYFLISYFSHLQHVGAFYFSNTIEKTGDFEIKSKYPASPELEHFIKQVRLKQKEIALRNLITYACSDDNINYLTKELNELRSHYPMTDDEYAVTVQRLKDRLAELG